MAENYNVDSRDRGSRCYLGLETSGQSTGVAVIRDEQAPADMRKPGMRHSDVILDLVQWALAEAGTSVPALAGIGVTIGPGTFTGLRVGLSTAKGLALPHRIPVKGVSTLLALALTVNRPDTPVVSLIDARKEQVYVGLYRDGAAVWGPAVVRPEELADALRPMLEKDQRVALCGDASQACAGLLVSAGIDCVVSDVASPSPVVVARVAREAIMRLGGDDIAALSPEYLRRTDAELRRD